MADSTRPDQRTVKVTVRLTPAEAALVDVARGPVDRAPWIRETALAAVKPAPRRKPGACKHESLRLVKGVCPGCGQWVVKKRDRA